MGLVVPLPDRILAALRYRWIPRLKHHLSRLPIVPSHCNPSETRLTLCLQKLCQLHLYNKLDHQYLCRLLLQTCSSDLSRISCICLMKLPELQRRYHLDDRHQHGQMLQVTSTQTTAALSKIASIGREHSSRRKRMPRMTRTDYDFSPSTFWRSQGSEGCAMLLHLVPLIFAGHGTDFSSLTCMRRGGRAACKRPLMHLRSNPHRPSP